MWGWNKNTDNSIDSIIEIGGWTTNRKSRGI